MWQNWIAVNNSFHEAVSPEMFEIVLMDKKVNHVEIPGGKIWDMNDAESQVSALK